MSKSQAVAFWPEWRTFFHGNKAAFCIFAEKYWLFFSWVIIPAILGGAPLGRDIAEFFDALGALIPEGYGLTEIFTVAHVNRPQNYKFGTVGLPLEGTSCRIEADGEILLRGSISL